MLNSISQSLDKNPKNRLWQQALALSVLQQSLEEYISRHHPICKPVSVSMRKQGDKSILRIRTSDRMILTWLRMNTLPLNNHLLDSLSSQGLIDPGQSLDLRFVQE